MSTTLPLRPTAVDSSDADIDIQPVLASWSRAIDRFNTSLTADEEKKISLTDLSCPFALLKDAALVAQTKVEKARYPWTPTLHRVIEQINRYATVGDVLVQHHAEYTSLAWGTIRFLLQFAAEEPKTAELVTRGLNTVTQIVFRAEEYGKLFQTASNSESDRVFESLQENLVCLYAETLSFLVRAAIFYQKGTLRRVVSVGFSSDTKLKAILGQIQDYERNVEKDKNLLESESRKKQEDFENGVWLQAADFGAELTKLDRIYKEGTRKWFFDREEYLNFDPTTHGTRRTPTPSTDRFLWVSGKPGAGKSVLVSQLIKRLQQSDCTVVYVLCKAGHERKSTFSAIIRGMLFQLLLKSTNKTLLHRLILNLRQNRMMQDSTDCTEDLWIILEKMLRSEDNLLFVIDAIDECGDSVAKSQEFLRRCRNILASASSTARLVTISRVECNESDASDWNLIKIAPSDLLIDIRALIQERFDRSRALSKHPDREKLLEMVVTNADGVMLWADLTAVELAKGHWDPESVFEKPPRGIYPLYDECIRRLSTDEVAWPERRAVLRFVLASARPLSLRELALFMAFTKGLKRLTDYEQRGDPIIEAKEYIEECSPLLQVLEDDTVQLVHASLREYLHDSRIMYGEDFVECDIHHEFAKVLLLCLSTNDISASQSQDETPAEDMTDYATLFLVYHGKLSDDPDLPPQIARFIESEHGWHWFKDVRSSFNTDTFHLWQKILGSWSMETSRDTSGRTTWMLRNFAIITLEHRLTIAADELEELKISNDLAELYFTDGQYRNTIRVLESSRDLWNEHPRSGLYSAFILMNAHVVLSHLHEVIELCTETLAKSEELLGVEHSRTLLIMCSAAITYIRLRKWKEAETIAAKVLETRNVIREREGWTDLSLEHQIGHMLFLQDKFSEAEETLQQAIQERRRSGMHDDSSAILSMEFDLAQVYTYQKRFEEAKRLLKRTLYRGRLRQGPQHRLTLIRECYLAEIYAHLGKWEKAIALAREGLGKSRRLPDNMNIRVHALEVLVKSLHRQERYLEAQPFAEEWYKLLENDEGDDGVEPIRLPSMTFLSSIYKQIRRLDDARKLQTECIALLERDFPNHYLLKVLQAMVEEDNVRTSASHVSTNGDQPTDHGIRDVSKETDDARESGSNHDRASDNPAQQMGNSGGISITTSKEADM